MNRSQGSGGDGVWSRRLETVGTGNRIKGPRGRVVVLWSEPDPEYRGVRYVPLCLSDVLYKRKTTGQAVGKGDQHPPESMNPENPRDY